MKEASKEVKVKTGLLGLFAAELLFLIALVFTNLSIYVSGFGYFSFLALAALLILLLSAIRLMGVNRKFFDAFMAAIIEIILLVAIIIVSACVKDVEWCDHLVNVLSVVEKLMAIGVTFFTLTGCEELANEKSNENVAQLCKTSKYVTAIGILIYIIISSIISFGGIAPEHQAFTFFIILTVVVNVIAYVMYLVSVMRTKLLY